ncbi:hypothetical protein L0Y40_03325 [Candidatus Wolfebacteria bacterium]|nr:hypothetical protein [Candidatus Wolfebacteria bacterium]
MAKHQLKTQIIYCGDNLEVLKDLPDESVDLIYIDPPFNSNRNYEVFWGDTQEKRAFEDRFGDAAHYIDWMRPRVVELHRVLKKTGSFYYHCDWHASHYVKILLDQIFDFNNFQNEIIWSYRTGGSSQKYWARKHDSILFYTKSDKYTFNSQKEKAYTKSKSRKAGAIDYGGGTAEFFEDEGGVYNWVNARDVWDIPYINSQSKERLGYPTQKPSALLERIIEASSNKGDVVLDAFCGCGTTLVAAQKLGRKWVGIDISPTACRVMAQRLYDNFRLEEDKDFTVANMPRSEGDLRVLPPFEFQNWAVIALGGIPNRVKVGDYGIDGKLYPIEQEREKKEGQSLFGDVDVYYPIQVKQKDKAGRPDIDAFETAIRRDKRRRGYFIAFDFSRDALTEMKRLDKEGEIEIRPITVRELLDKSGFEKAVTWSFPYSLIRAN